MDEIVTVAIKAAGAASGSALALVFQPPKNKRDFVVRVVFSFGVGLLLGQTIHDEYLHWAQTWETMVAAATITSMASWWVMGAAVRIIGAWKPPKS